MSSIEDAFRRRCNRRLGEDDECEVPRDENSPLATAPAWAKDNEALGHLQPLGLASGLLKNRL